MKYLQYLIFCLSLFLSTAIAKENPKPQVFTITFDAEINEKTSEAFIKAFEKAESLQPHFIIVELTTLGGSVDDGWRMARTIERSKVPTICVVENEVNSMGTFLLQSCTYRSISSRSTLMAHYPFYGTVEISSAKQFDNLVEHSRGMRHSMLVQLTRRSKLTEAQVKAKLDVGDWVMTADEALAAGEVDFVIDTVEFLQKYLISFDKVPQ